MIHRAATSLLLALFLGGIALPAEMPAPPVPQQELQGALRHRRFEQDCFAAETQQMEHELPRLGKLQDYAFDPNSPMPDAQEGECVAVADGGLLFDNAQSCLSYIGNVRVNDSRVQLRAAHRFFIRLPQNDKEEQAKKELIGETKPTKNAPTPEQIPAPAAGSTPPHSADTQAAHAPRPQEKVEGEPAQILAENAAVDLRNDKFLLEGRKAQPSLSLTRGGDLLLLDCAADGTPAKIYGNYQGDVLLQGRNIIFVWHNEAGEEWRLECESGPMYYQASIHCLVALGKTRISSPSSTLESHRALYIVFTPDAEATAAAKKTKSPFSQFTSMRFKDVDYMDAYGEVKLTMAAEGERPAGNVQGEAMHYEAATGECLIEGNPCRLAYGANTLVTQGYVKLLSNGDTIIQGNDIGGDYERPLTKDPQAPLVPGKWRAKGPITYRAGANCITAPEGFTAQDEHGSFHCTGQADIYLTAQKEAKPKPAPRGIRMPNLAIARQNGISRIVITGNVRMHNDATPDTPECDLRCDFADANLETTVCTLLSFNGRSAYARYGQYELDAASASDGQAEVKLLENGDISASGSHLRAALPGEKGLTTIDCDKFMHLARESALLTLGENSRINSPDGILTARAELQAELMPGESAFKAPANRPQLSYNYSGLRRASTPAGGTLRSAQASMQCTGAIDFELKEGADLTGDKGARAAIRSASAKGKVMLAGKDSTGRLIRASGDRLDYDAPTDSFKLSGKVVTLVDEYNTHTAYGDGACITIDPNNNVHITGAHQITTADKVRHQIELQKKTNKK